MVVEKSPLHSSCKRADVKLIESSRNLSEIAWFRKPTWQPVVTLKELLQSFPPVLGRRYTMCL